MTTATEPTPAEIDSRPVLELVQYLGIDVAEIGPDALGDLFPSFYGILVCETDGHLVLGLREGQDPGERDTAIRTLLHQHLRGGAR